MATTRYIKLENDTGYTDKIAALLPAEMVATFTGMNAVIQGVGATWEAKARIIALWLTFVFVLIVTIAYLLKKNKEAEDNDPTKKMSGWQLFLTVVTFSIWALALGGAVRETFSVWDVSYENAIVAIWTLGVPKLI